MIELKKPKLKINSNPDLFTQTTLEENMSTVTVKENALLNAPELSQLNTTRADQIRSTFVPMADLLDTFEQPFAEIIEESKNEITKEVTAKAKRLRLDIAKVRIETGKLKDKQKENIKLEDKAIMGVHNILVWSVSEKENKLKEIENHFENLEKERLEKLQIKRVKELSEFVEDAHERDLSSMDEEVWIPYFNAKKQEYLDRIEAEYKAEEERQAKIEAERIENERIRVENEKLRKEAEEKERLAKIEADKRARAEAERLEKENKERLEREEKERIEREKIQAKLDAERKEQERLKAELKAKEDAEKKAEAEREAQRQAELSKGDEDKIADLKQELKNFKSNYSFKSKPNQIMLDKVLTKIDEAIQIIERELI